MTTTVGQSTPRVDGISKVTGKSQYSGDVILPGMLWGAVLRSPVPHARIVSIDASRARALPGVHAVLTAQDLPNPDVRIGRAIYDMPVLARERVRFVGEKVAAVAAESQQLAEVALGLIDVRYEEARAVFDPESAMQADAPILHPAFASYRGAPKVPAINNVHSYRTWGTGDIAAGLARAEVVFEDVLTVPMQHPGFLEPHSCMVSVEPNGRTLVWPSCKQPFGVRANLAELADIGEDTICVMPVSIGGDFGGKGSLVDIPIAYFLSRASGRPVRRVMTYAEELTAGAPRHAATITMRTGLLQDGRIVARHARMVLNTGAYAGHKPDRNLGLNGCESALGPYRIVDALVEAYCVYTNQLSCGHMRAPGWAQATFAVESHMDMIARRMGLDPLELRRRNALQAGDPAPTGEHWRNPSTQAVLTQAAALAGWDKPRPGPLVGRGLSLSYEHIGLGKSGAILTVEESGQVHLLTGVPDVGTGAHTVLQQLVAETLTIPPEDVSVEMGDTDAALFDSGSGADRVTHVAGTAVHKTAGKLRDELCWQAAELMGWNAEKVALRDGSFVGDGADESVGFKTLAGRVAQASGGTYKVSEAIALTHHVEERNFTAQVAEVEVDPDTGSFALRRFVSVQDVGTVLNPRLAEGQVEGGVVMGLGYACMEGLRVEGGRVTTANLGDYKMPTVADIPIIGQAFLPSDEGPAPYGAKAVGETALHGVAPAIANAIHDAVGVRLTSLPLSAEQVYQALKGFA